PTVRRFDLSNTPASGPVGAVANITIFSDFECPFCSRIVEPIHDAEKKMPGQIRVTFKQFPLISIHPNAKPAAIASLAAHRQGKFWEYHDLLFKNQKRLGKADLIGWARVIGLDVVRFEKDLDDPALAAQVSADMADGSRSGVRGTPSVYLNGRKMKAPPTNADALVDLIRAEVLQIED
ncbi:MAG: protein-disulfide isomerase, partial [Myxococcota bacterium]